MGLYNDCLKEIRKEKTFGLDRSKVEVNGCSVLLGDRNVVVTILEDGDELDLSDFPRGTCLDLWRGNDTDAGLHRSVYLNGQSAFVGDIEHIRLSGQAILVGNNARTGEPITIEVPTDEVGVFFFERMGDSTLDIKLPCGNVISMVIGELSMLVVTNRDKVYIATENNTTDVKHTGAGIIQVAKCYMSDTELKQLVNVIRSDMSNIHVTKVTGTSSLVLDEKFKIELKVWEQSCVQI